MAAAAEAGAGLVTAMGEARQDVAGAAGVAREAQGDADRLSSATIDLEQASELISAIVLLIGDIARRTGLLSFNGSIEAARSGEMGRGFSVVAQEVKSLAGQAVEAAKKVGSHLAQIARATETTVQTSAAVSERARHLREITESLLVAMDGHTKRVVTMAEAVDQKAVGGAAISTAINEIQAIAATVQDLIASTDAAFADVDSSIDVLRHHTANFLRDVTV